jgi:hypothetical protein
MATTASNDPEGLGNYNYINREYLSFDKGKYDVSQYSYPNDLFGNPVYGSNYVVFYINVAEDSYLIKEGKESVVDVADDQRAGSQIVKLGAAAAATVLGAAALTAGGAGVLDMLKRGVNIVDLTAAASAAGLTGIVSALADGKLGRQTKRIKTAIALHVPNELNIRYSTDWREEEMGLMMAGAQVSEGAIKAFTGGDASKLSAPVNSSLTALALATPVVGSFASAASGLAANPKKEQLFKGVNFREFQLSYQFFPRDIDESANIAKIIQQLKLHMHPEFKDEAAFIYIYPSEFDIFYYNGPKENTSIHRHTSCVMTDMSVNYTPNGLFNTFADGTPTQINIQMSFKELAILTKKQIEDGF